MLWSNISSDLQSSNLFLELNHTSCILIGQQLQLQSEMFEFSLFDDQAALNILQLRKNSLNLKDDILFIDIKNIYDKWINKTLVYIEDKNQPTLMSQIFWLYFHTPLALCSVSSAELCPKHLSAPGWGHACCHGNSVWSRPVWTAGLRSEACWRAAAAPAPAYPEDEKKLLGKKTREEINPESEFKLTSVLTCVSSCSRSLVLCSSCSSSLMALLLSALLSRACSSSLIRPAILSISSLRSATSRWACWLAASKEAWSSILSLMMACRLST